MRRISLIRDDLRPGTFTGRYNLVSYAKFAPMKHSLAHAVRMQNSFMGTFYDYDDNQQLSRPSERCARDLIVYVALYHVPVCEPRGVGHGQVLAAMHRTTCRNNYKQRRERKVSAVKVINDASILWPARNYANGALFYADSPSENCFFNTLNSWQR